MPDYRRYHLPGGRYFFTVNLLQRYPNDLLVCHIDHLTNCGASSSPKTSLPCYSGFKSVA